MLDLNNKIDKHLFDLMVPFINGHSGNSWCAVLRTEAGNKEFLEMKNRPCFGEMRSYGPLSTRPEDQKPGDLGKPLPIGVYREAIGLPFWQYEHSDRTDLFNFLFSKKDSPWAAGLPEQEHIHLVYKEGDKNPRGAIFTDTEVDATVMLNLFRFLKSFLSNGCGTQYNTERKSGHEPLASLILATIIYGGSMTYYNHEYSLAKASSVTQMRDRVTRKYARNKPTWAQGDDYNRPFLGYVFTPEGMNEKEMLPFKAINPFGDTFDSLMKLRDKDKVVNRLHELGIN